MVCEAKIEASILLDKKHWIERKQGGARPLRGMTWRVLSDDAIFEKVRKQQGFDTLGEARDLVGAELRKRLGNIGHG